MTIQFSKYQGAGNDFIMIDGRKTLPTLDSKTISHLCNQHFGIGADGLLLLSTEEGFDFRMVYYNSDGSEATFCGNGGRCIVAFAAAMGLNKKEYHFIAADGIHQAEIIEHKGNKSIISLGMQDASIYSFSPAVCYLNTGTYHLVKFVDDVSELDVVKIGRSIRNEVQYAPHGTNVNFVAVKTDGLYLRTYEKGVENETLACGTGATAAAISASLLHGGNEFKVHTLGGTLKVTFAVDGDKYTDVILTGEATKVFDGQIEL